MRTEVHVHGSIFLCKGVRLKQVEQALRPWLEYLDVETLADARSLEQEEAAKLLLRLGEWTVGDGDLSVPEPQDGGVPGEDDVNPAEVVAGSNWR